MKDICPIRIITGQDPAEFKIFCEKIDRQFIAFAKLEFGEKFDLQKHKWWAVTNARALTIAEFSDVLLKAADLPLAFLEDGFYDAKRFVFIFYAGDAHFNNLVQYVDGVNDLRKSRGLLSGIVDVYYYGICFFSNTNPGKQNIDMINAQSSKFDVLTFLSDINFHYANNPYGFKDLDVEGTHQLNTEHVLDKSIQVIFHVGSTKGSLSRAKERITKVLMTAGVYSITFEPDIHKHNIAVSLLHPMFSKFCMEQEHKSWCDEAKANQYFKSLNLDGRWGWPSVYKHFVAGFETNDEASARNIEIKKVLFNPPVSAWSLFSQWLIPEYYLKYIRTLVENLRSTAHSFMYGSIDGFNNHLNKKRQDILTGSSDVAVDAVGKLLKNIWAENNKLEDPAGVQQLMLVLDKVNTFIDGQAMIVKGLTEDKTPAGSSFPQLDDYPLKNIPKPLLAFYRDFAQHDVEKKELENEKDKKKGFEQIILTKFVKLLQFHPVPLSLFVRAIILGIVLPLVVFAGLLLIPDVVINTSFLESGRGVIILFIACFSGAIASAFFKYWLGMLRKIKIIIKKYLAWVFWKTQQRIYKDTLHHQYKYYQDLIKECDRIKRNISGYSFADTVDEKTANDVNEAFIPSASYHDQKKVQAVFDDLKGVLFPPADPMFAQGMFQRDILGKFDGELPILNEDRVTVKIFFNNMENTLGSINNAGIQSLLFKALFIKTSFFSNPIYQYFYEKVIVPKIEPADAAIYWPMIRQEFCAMLIKELHGRISLENAENIQELIFGQAPSDQGHNFNKNQNGIFVNKLIQSRFYPSVLLQTLNPYSQLSYIIPEDHGYDDERWAEVFGNKRRLDHVIHRKSIVSILHTFSLKGLSDIFNDENKQQNNNQ